MKKIKSILNDKSSKRVIDAILYGAGGAILSKIFLTLFNMVLARHLTEKDYGAYSLINNTLQTFIVFAGAGMGVTVTRYVALYKEKNKNLLGIMLGTLTLINVLISFVVSVLVFAFSNKISILLNSEIDITYLLKITSLTIFVTSIVLTLQGVLQGFEEYKKNAIIQTISNILNFVIGIIISKKFGLVGAICSLLAMQLILLFLTVISIIKIIKRKNVKLKYSFVKEVKEAILKVSIPSFLATILVLPLMWFTNFYFSSKIGLEEFGAFSICVQWFNIINYIPQQFGQLKPIYTQLYDEEKFEEVKKYLRKIIIFTIGFSTICSLIFILGRTLILSRYGEYYLGASNAFVVMMITTIMFAIQSQYGSVFQAIGKSWICFILNGIWGITFVIAFLLLYKNGIIGYAYTYLISYSVYSLISSIVFKIILNKAESNSN
mgnify:CR=1 FL=1